jgi:hypothetical protein
MNDPLNVHRILIPIQVSPERKAHWLAQSRAEGKKITDWIVERVERGEIEGGKDGPKPVANPHP